MSSALPSGISLTDSNKFRVNIMVGGIRMSRTCDSIDDAKYVRQQFTAGVDVSKQPVASQSWTVRKAIDGYIDMRIGTSTSSKTDMSKFTSYRKLILQQLGADTLLNSLDKPSVSKLYDHMVSKGYSASYINYTGTIVNGLQKYAYERGGKREQPTRMARMKVTEGRQRYLTGSETHDMFNYFAVHQYYDISNLVRCYLDTGARKSELLELQWSDVDMDNDKLTFNGIRTKNAKSRTIPMTSQVKQILQELHNRRHNSPLVFAHITEQQLYDAWNKMREALGLSSDEQFVVHMLRHTCCTQLLSEGVNPKVVCAWMGHASLQETDKYAHAIPSHLDTAAQALDNINNRKVMNG